MRKTALEHFDDIRELEVADGPGITVEDLLPGKCEKVWKSLKALEIIKGTFMWLEDNPYVIYVGRINDIETMLTEEDFKNEEEFNTLKEVLE